jgi:predicted TIM-barrel fold metal-dependent hydrolase
MRTIDVDQHLFESRGTWADYIDPAHRSEALSIEDDAAGWPWLTWQGRPLGPIEIPKPEQGAALGDDRLRRLRGEPPLGSFDELVPAAYRTAADRLDRLNAFGFDAAVLFPNYGLLWEKMLVEDRAAQRANARAYNRFMADTCQGGQGRLFGVAHLLLHDPAWAVEEIRRVAAQGVRLAMIAPAPVDGKPLSHADFDPVWRAFSEEGVAPVFHVSGFESPIHPAWHVGETDDGGLFLDSIFLWLAPAVAIANLILSGTLERFPDLRIGVVELTAGWVPSFLLHIDGATDFFAQRHGGPFLPLTDRPSEYFLRHVRVAALPYEMPGRLVGSVGEDTFMMGSDWPHAEGVADPKVNAERAAAGLGEAARAKLLGANAAWLLHEEALT